MGSRVGGTGAKGMHIKQKRWEAWGGMEGSPRREKKKRRGRVGSVNGSLSRGKQLLELHNKVQRATDAVSTSPVSY